MARIGSLFGVVVTGVLISLRYTALVDGSLDRERLSVPLRGAVDAARRQALSTLQPTGRRSQQAQLVHRAPSDAAVDAFRLAIGPRGGLAVLAGVVAVTALRERDARVAASGSPCGVLVGAHQGVTVQRPSGGVHP